MNYLDYLITNSEDSILKEYSYASGELTILLYLTEIDQTINLKIKTDCLSFDNHYLEKGEELYRTCRIEIQELLNALSVEHAVYLPSTTFPELMKDAKFNYSLAYGKIHGNKVHLFVNRLWQTNILFVARFKLHSNKLQ